MKRQYRWRPSRPDHRDLTFSATATTLPPLVDLRANCPPVYDQGELGSCHDSETEVLCERGWAKFADLNGTERLATVNPETSELTFETPTRLVRFPYQGQMVCAANQSLNFKVTPDHNMLVREWDGSKRTLADKYVLTTVKNIGWYVGLMNRVVWKGTRGMGHYTLRGVQHKHVEQRSDKQVGMAAWLRFLGFYLAEGTMLRRDQRKNHISYKIQLAATKEREKAFARQVLVDLGVKALELPDRFTFCNRRIYEAMEGLGLNGVKAGGKFVPDFVFAQPAEMIREFLKGHFEGDGTEYGTSRCHYTGSPQLSDDLQRLIFLSGDESRISVRVPRNNVSKAGRPVVGTLDEYRISVCREKSISIERKKSIFLEDYDGDVFCAEVPTHHTLVTRRKGKILISGNCTANAIAAAVDFDRMKQGEALLAPSRLFIYYNERAMEGTVTSDSGAAIKDGVKSVNKLGVCAEVLWPYNTAKFKRKPTKDCYTKALLSQSLLYQKVDNSKLDQLKGALAQGLPFVFGFSVYASFESDAVAKTGVVPMPVKHESALGGHAVLAVGYDDARQVFIVRNSWGEGWGDRGYFYLPYQYVTSKSLADDFWVIQKVE